MLLQANNQSVRPAMNPQVLAAGLAGMQAAVKAYPKAGVA
jgi:hypothetical protein